VPITGENAKRVLFGAINIRTAHRVVLAREHAGGADACAFFLMLRAALTPRRQIWLVLDGASAHTADASEALTARLRIELVWLPKQAPELRPMDQLWKELKPVVAAKSPGAERRCAGHQRDALGRYSDADRSPQIRRAVAALLAPRYVAKLLATYLENCVMIETGGNRSLRPSSCRADGLRRSPSALRRTSELGWVARLHGFDPPRRRG
jgi:transposase